MDIATLVCGARTWHGTWHAGRVHWLQCSHSPVPPLPQSRCPSFVNPAEYFMSVVQDAAAVDRLAASFDQANGLLLQPGKATGGGSSNFLAGGDSSATTSTNMATGPGLQAVPGPSHALEPESSRSNVGGISTSSSGQSGHGEHQSCPLPPRSIHGAVGGSCPSAVGCALVQQQGAVVGPGDGQDLLPCGRGAGWAQEPDRGHACHVSGVRDSGSSHGGSEADSLDEEREERERERDDRPPVWLQVRGRRTAGMSWSWGIGCKPTRPQCPSGMPCPNGMQCLLGGVHTAATSSRACVLCCRGRENPSSLWQLPLELVAWFCGRGALQPNRTSHRFYLPRTSHYRPAYCLHSLSTLSLPAITLESDPSHPSHYHPPAGAGAGATLRPLLGAHARHVAAGGGCVRQLRILLRDGVLQVAVVVAVCMTCVLCSTAGRSFHTPW